MRAETKAPRTARRSLTMLAQFVSDAAAELSTEQSAASLSAKFSETTFTLSYRGLDSFFGGLEALLVSHNGFVGKHNDHISASRLSASVRYYGSPRELLDNSLQCDSAIHYYYISRPTKHILRPSSPYRTTFFSHFYQISFDVSQPCLRFGKR